MSFLSVLAGMFFGGLVSSGAIIGIFFLGSLVPWWALILISVGGTLFGGFIAGLIAKGAFPGALAGFLSGLIVLIAIFLFAWLYYKQQIIDFYNDAAGDINQAAEDLVTLLGMDPTTEVGQAIIDAIIKFYNDYGANIDELAAKYFPVFGLIIGAVFGGVAAVIGIITGLIGGLFTRKKDEEYDTYY